MKSEIKKYSGQNFLVNDRLKNYLAWIANLGVVPLFLLAAFLLAPAFFFLASLLLVVTLVLETMTTLLSQILIKNLYYFKQSFLPRIGPSVKGFILASCIIIQASPWSTAQAALETEIEEIVISKGDIHHLQILEGEKYLISNKEVLGTKYDNRKKELLVLGKMLGTSEVQIVGHKKTSITRVLVIDKTRDLKLSGLVMNLRKFEIKPKFIGDKILLDGELKNASDFFKISKILIKENSYIENNISISETIRKSIIGIIYKNLLEKNINYMNCELKDFKINCFYQDSILINESLKKYLKEELAINLIESNAELIKNYSIKFKFIQIEQLDGMDLNFGLSQIESNLKEIINKPIINIIEKNSVLLKENHINISTLAEPTIVTMPKTPTTISLGSDTPFQTYDKEKNTTSTSWHFSGLKINLQLLPIEDRVKMEYESELTKVSDENTSSGSKGKSSIIVKLNTPYRLFEVNMKTIGKNSEELPLISKFPILGELFKSKSNSENYKRIYAIIEVVENE